ncbi:unnamed protein product [marine sediment metagenome]|uniref:Uncharacterized protein n=1 Tax=marine sediment metagenome TaxID=412755 RepID=X1BGY9_9ZZZZ
MMDPIATTALGLVLIAVGVMGLLVAFVKDRHHTRGTIPEDGELSAAQFVRLPREHVEPVSLDRGYSQRARRTADV